MFGSGKVIRTTLAISNAITSLPVYSGMNPLRPSPRQSINRPARLIPNRATGFSERWRLKELLTWALAKAVDRGHRCWTGSVFFCFIFFIQIVLRSKLFMFELVKMSWLNFFRVFVTDRGG